MWIKRIKLGGIPDIGREMDKINRLYKRAK
jgi:hypothetical protein